MEIVSKDKKSKEKEDYPRKKKAKCEWFIYCEGCDDLVSGECPKHPYVSDAVDAEPEVIAATKPNCEVAESKGRKSETSKKGIQPKIVSVGSVPGARKLSKGFLGRPQEIEERMRDTGHFEGDEERFEIDETSLEGDELRTESFEERLGGAESSSAAKSTTVRLVPAAHFETEVSKMTDEEYYRSVVYIPCKKEIRLDEYGNEMLVYDVKQADGSVLQNFYTTSADDYTTTLESSTRKKVPADSAEFHPPEAYPIKRVRRRSPLGRIPPDGHQIYACNLCGKRLTQNSSLTVHMRIHTGEKPYRCEFCPKRFNHHSNMVKHERVHTGAQPYVCPYCGKSFNQSTHLKTHIFSGAHSRGRFKKQQKAAEKVKRKPGRKKKIQEEAEEEEEAYRPNVERVSRRSPKKSVKLVLDGDQVEMQEKIDNECEESYETERVDYEEVDRVEIKAEVIDEINERVEIVKEENEGGS